MAILTSASVTSGLPFVLHRTGYSSRRGEEARYGSDLGLLQTGQTGTYHGYAAQMKVPLQSSFADAFKGFSTPSNLFRCRPRSRLSHHGARALAMEVAEEASLPNPGAFKSLDVSLFQSIAPRSFPLPRKNRTDDASLRNPLLRLERMGCGWLGVILEWEGVIAEDDADVETKSWTALAEEEGKRPPPAFILKRAEGIKNEQAIAEVFCWSRDTREVNRLARRKEEIYQEMQGGIYRLKPGSKEFILTLRKYKFPIALVSTRPRKILERATEAVGMEGFFNVVVAAEDVYRGKPDSEMFMYAAHLLDFIPERCIVMGNSNQSVEAAHDSFMKCIAVVGKHPVYDLGAADLVVRRLDDLSLVDLKNLADLDSPEFKPPELESEPELAEDECPTIGIQTALEDFW